MSFGDYTAWACPQCGDYRSSGLVCNRCAELNQVKRERDEAIAILNQVRHLCELHADEHDEAPEKMLIPDVVYQFVAKTHENLGDCFYHQQARRRENSEPGSLNVLTADVLDWVCLLGKGLDD